MKKHIEKWWPSEAALCHMEQGIDDTALADRMQAFNNAPRRASRGMGKVSIRWIPA